LDEERKGWMEKGLLQEVGEMEGKKEDRVSGGCCNNHRF
jgi:hypothetical protein